MSLRAFFFTRSPLALAFGVGALTALLLFPAQAYVALSSYLSPPEALPGQTLDPGRRLTVHEDMGGSVVKRLVHIDRLRRARIDVDVRGVCASACTAILTIPYACSTRDALWMFHAIQPDPRLQRFADDYLGGHTPLKGTMERAWLSQFPPALADWMEALHHSLPPRGEYWLTGGALIDAGWIASCPQSRPDEDRARAQARAWSRGTTPPFPLPGAPHPLAVAPS